MFQLCALALTFSSPTQHVTRPLPLQENRRKQRRDGFLNTLLQHGEDFKVFHRETRRAGHKLAKSVLQDFESKARRENKERERAQRERIKALRDNNLDEYMKLINDTKNERIQALLAETDNYLHELGDKVRLQKDSIKQTNGGGSSGGGGGAEGEVVEGGAEPPPLAKGESHSERSAYNALTHSVTEEIERQPKMLKGGELKEYQLQVHLHLSSLPPPPTGASMNVSRGQRPSFNGLITVLTT